MVEANDMLTHLMAATGADPALDQALYALFDEEGRGKEAYTASVEAAQSLVQRRLGGWNLHVGFDATGVFPYAVLSQGEERLECGGPTVPLAILRVAVGAHEKGSRGLAPSRGCRGQRP